VFANLAFQGLQQGYEGWVWVLGITAAVYNPLFPVHLTREIWSAVNVVTIGIAAVSAFSLRFELNGHDSGHEEARSGADGNGR
jgi:hypothetical protein